MDFIYRLNRRYPVFRSFTAWKIRALLGTEVQIGLHLVSYHLSTLESHGICWMAVQFLKLWLLKKLHQMGHDRITWHYKSILKPGDTNNEKIDAFAFHNHYFERFIHGDVFNRNYDARQAIL